MKFVFLVSIFVFLISCLTDQSAVKQTEPQPAATINESVKTEEKFVSVDDLLLRLKNGNSKERKEALKQLDKLEKDLERFKKFLSESNDPELQTVFKERYGRGENENESEEIDESVPVSFYEVIVTDNDTLIALANDFNTSVKLIKKFNPKIKNDKDLVPGSIIKIPSQK